MTERVLTEGELRLAMLARQRLLTRERATIPRLIERVGFLQTQHAPSAYVGLFSRLQGFERGDLTKALERRTVIQATTLRVTIHMCSRRDYWPVIDAIGDARRAWWLRVTRGTTTAGEMETLARRLRRALADGPRKRADLVEALGITAATWSGLGLWVDMVRVPPSGTWERRRGDLYGLAEDWVGPRPPLDPGAGRDLLVRRYLSGFAPATPAAIADWAALSAADLAPSIERVATRRFIDERGRTLVDLPRGQLPDPSTPTPVRFIATFDPILMVHARATQVLPEPYRPQIFNTKTPHSIGTVLIGGQVRATWHEHDGRIEVTPLEPLPKRVVRELEMETGRLQTFID